MTFSSIISRLRPRSQNAFIVVGTFFRSLAIMLALSWGSPAYPVRLVLLPLLDPWSSRVELFYLLGFLSCLAVLHFHRGRLSGLRLESICTAIHFGFLLLYVVLAPMSLR